jgi:peptidyl-prolyl cis-trans isomerase D
VKGSILAELRNEQATKLFADSAEGFTNEVYQAPATSLQPAADKYHLTIRQASVARTPNPALAPTDPLNNAKLLDAVFSADSLQQHHNTAAIDLGGSGLISARVVHYTPAAVPALAAIKAQVQQKYVVEQSAKLAREAGAAQLAALQKTPSTTGFGTVLKVSRSDAQGVPRDALAAIFKVDAQHLPQYVGTDLGDAGYAIYRVNAVDQPAAVDATKLAGVAQQLAQIDGQSELSAYYASLKARSKVKQYGSLNTPADSQ